MVSFRLSRSKRNPGRRYLRRLCKTSQTRREINSYSVIGKSSTDVYNKLFITRLADGHQKFSKEKKNNIEDSEQFLMLFEG
jgi:hypothetical protein